MTISTAICLPYQNFNQAQSTLFEIEAIDYFLAKDLINYFIVKNRIISFEQSNLVFHLVVAVNKSLREGHTCLPLSAIANTKFAFAAEDDGVISHQGFKFPDLETLSQCLMQLNVMKDEKQPIVYFEQALYLRRYFQFEQEVISYLSQIKSEMAKSFTQQNVRQQEITSCLSRLFPQELIKQGDQEVDWQKVAVANVLNKRFSIIAGGPGTGKTYTVTKLLAASLMLKQSFDEQVLNIRLVAPTGKAAQRLSESLINAVNGFSGVIDDAILAKIPTTAETIHRLLGVVPHNPNFKFNQENKLSVDLLVVDEVSMVDLPLMARLIRALPAHCQLVLLGDADQLPSVAVGNILSALAPRPHNGYSKANCIYLRDVTHHNSIKTAKKHPNDLVTFLTQSRRFDGQGGIGQLAKMVIAGNSHQSWQLINEKHADIELLSTNYRDWLIDIVRLYYLPIASANSVNEAFSLLNQFRVLCATRQGLQGVEQLNELVEETLFALGNKNATNPLYHGKPIMITQNDYSLGLYNGDIGIVWHIDGQLMAVFEQASGELLSVLPARLPSYETVYAMTIHKTQGSEFKRLLMMLPDRLDNQLLTRELLYTGITRAKESIMLVAQQAVWHQGVESRVVRYSGITI